MVKKLSCACVIAVGLTAALVAAPTSSAERTGGAQIMREADCADFATQAAAQNYFIDHGGPSSDPDGLDADHDGIACEANPCPCSTGGGGGGGGGGPAPPPPPPPDPVKVEKLCGKFVGISGSKVCLKATTQSGNLRKVEDFRFRGLPARCDNGTKPKLAGKRSKIDGDGKKFRSRRLSVLGSFSAVNAKAVGKLKGGSTVAGEVRVRARNNAGAPCDTGGRKFKVN